MNTKGLLTFVAGLMVGLAGYHFVVGSGGDPVADAEQGDGSSGIGSMLGAKDPDPDGEAEKRAGAEVMMPEGFDDVRSVKDIMLKAGPRDRFQALMAFVEGIEAHEIEAALAEIRAGASNQFDPEAMFASHLLLMPGSVVGRGPATADDDPEFPFEE